MSSSVHIVNMGFLPIYIGLVVYVEVKRPSRKRDSDLIAQYTDKKLENMTRLTDDYTSFHFKKGSTL